MRLTRPLAHAVLACTLLACAAEDDRSGQPRVERGDLVVVARASGELRAAHSQDLRVPPARRRLRIARLVEDGKKVRPDELLVAFDPEEFQKVLRDEQADLSTARKELEKARLEARSELERLELESQRTEVDLEKARIRAGSDLQVTAMSEILKARADVRALEIASTEKGRAVALARERHVRNRQSLEARIRKAEREVELARETLEDITLKAPVAGTALVAETWGGSSMRKFQVGDNAWTGRVVVSLPDLTSMEALLYVEEADSALVREGLPVSVTLDAAPEREFRGRVQSAALLAESLSWNNPAKVFRVVASLDETDPELMRPGLRLQAQIELERHPSVLSVPIEVVEKRNGHTFVRTGSGERVEVTLGARNDRRVIVLEGLEEGVRVRPAMEETS